MGVSLAAPPIPRDKPIASANANARLFILICLFALSSVESIMIIRRIYPKARKINSKEVGRKRKHWSRESGGIRFSSYSRIFEDENEDEHEEYPYLQTED